MGAAKRRKMAGNYPEVESKSIKPTRLRSSEQMVEQHKKGDTALSFRQMAKAASRR